MPIAVIVAVVFAALLALVAFSPTAEANHSWNGYHWGRTSNPFTLNLGDNVSSTTPPSGKGVSWDKHLEIASGYLQQDPNLSPDDWHRSTVMDVPVVKGLTTPRQCKPQSGRVEVCNEAYGWTGWLGVAQIWLSNGHIVQGTAKMNDTYFNDYKWYKGRYDTPEWRQFVMCQEVGHTFGLGHVNENNGDPNTGSCMDYTNDPDGSSPQTDNRYPNQHDHELLGSLYSHTTGDPTTVGSTSAASKVPPEANRGDLNSRAEWGRLIHRSPDGLVEVYERDFGNGQKVNTRVIRAVEKTPALEKTNGGNYDDGHNH